MAHRSMAVSRVLVPAVTMPETTIGLTYESTLDGRNAARHERSVHAGSGEVGWIVCDPPAPMSKWISFAPDAAFAA